MLEPWVPARGAKRAKPKPWVQLGVPESQVFQAVVPIASTNRNATPQSFFLEAVQATNVRAEDRIIDVLKLELNKQPLACVAASPRGAITGLMEMMDGLGTRVGMAEPAPAALYRAGAYSRKAPRGSKLAVRFFLGRDHAIGVLAAGPQPLFWHTFDLPPGEETAAILAAYSTLWMMGRHCRITVPIDTVIVHGRSEVVLTQDPTAFRERTGARLIRCSLPDYDLAAAALGVALANPLADDIGLDLANTLKPAPSIRDIFPWVELAVHGALLGAVSLFLNVTAAEANARHQAVRIQLKAFTWLKDQDQAKLDDERKSVQERLKAIETFRSGRVRLVGGLADYRRDRARQHRHHLAIGRRPGHDQVQIGHIQLEETTDHQLHDADVRGWFASARARRLPRHPARRAGAQAKLPPDRGHRPPIQSDPSWRPPVGVLQHRRSAQGGYEPQVNRPSPPPRA